MEAVGRVVVVMWCLVVILVDVALAVAVAARTIIMSTCRVAGMHCLVQARAFADGTNPSRSSLFLSLLRHGVCSGLTFVLRQGGPSAFDCQERRKPRPCLEHVC